MTNNNFYYDKEVQRYRWADTKRFLSAEAVENLTVLKIDQIKQDLGTIGQLLIDRKINLQTWEKQTASTIKDLHLQFYLLGIGGLKQITQRDYGIVGQEMLNQYAYLRGFSEDLISAGMSIAQFENRVSLYADAARGTYQRARQEAHLRAGYLFERRIRTKIESCPECVSYALSGWQAIGSLPLPTKQCSCKMKCGCFKEFSVSNPANNPVETPTEETPEES